MNEPIKPSNIFPLERLETLREMANEGDLSADDYAEYEMLIEGFDLIAILQTKARSEMDQRPS